MQPAPITSHTNISDPLFRSQVATAIGVSGLLSLFGSLAIVFFIVRGKLYTKLHTRIVLYLSISDFIQSLGSISSFAWVSMDAYPSPICTFQSVMFEFGDNASSFASAIIATFVFITVNSFDFKFSSPGKKFEIISICFIFGVPLIFTFIGFMRQVDTGRLFYTNVGFNSWCWISTSYPLERMMIHYTWIFLIAFYLICIYTYLGYVLYNSLKIVDNPSMTKKHKKLVYKMIGFPIIFLVVFFPLGLERLVTVISTAHGLTLVSFPNGYVAFAIVIFTSNGFWNAVYYGYTRKIFKSVTGSTSSELNRTQTPNPHP